jgi:hypothetical protein
VVSLFLQEQGDDMDGLDNLIFMLGSVLNTSRKRHIVGGILLSVSALFGGLAVTVMTMTDKETTEEE